VEEGVRGVEGSFPVLSMILDMPRRIRVSRFLKEQLSVRESTYARKEAT
jgi:hypothetical protein